jgi:hypothetical protein
LPGDLGAVEVGFIVVIGNFRSAALPPPLLINMVQVLKRWSSSSTSAKASEGRRPRDLTVIGLTGRIELALLWSAQEQALGIR